MSGKKYIFVGLLFAIVFLGIFLRLHKSDSSTIDLNNQSGEKLHNLELFTMRRMDEEKCPELDEDGHTRPTDLGDFVEKKGNKVWKVFDLHKDSIVEVGELESGNYYLSYNDEDGLQYVKRLSDETLKNSFHLDVELE